MMLGRKKEGREESRFIAQQSNARGTESEGSIYLKQHSIH